MPAALLALLPGLLPMLPQLLGGSGAGGLGSLLRLGGGGLGSLAVRSLGGGGSPILALAGGAVGKLFGSREPKRAGHVARTNRWIDGCQAYGLGSSVCTWEQIQRQLTNMAPRPHYAQPYQRLQGLVQATQQRSLLSSYRAPTSSYRMLRW